MGYYRTMKTNTALITACIALTFTGCATPKYQRAITKPDGTYKLISCDQPALNLTVDGDTSRNNFDLVKWYNAVQKQHSLPNFLP